MDKIDFLYSLYENGKLRKSTIYPCDEICAKCNKDTKNICYALFKSNKPSVFGMDFDRFFLKYPEARLVL